MREDLKIILSIIVCIIFLILISILGNIKPDSEVFIILFLFSLGIIIAILSLFMSKNIIIGLIYTVVYVSANFLIIVILIPYIGDFILKIPACESISLLEGIITPFAFMYLPILLSNIVSFSLTFVLGRFVLRFRKQII